MQGDIVVGDLSLLEIDQPWFRCRFYPGDSWDRFRVAFENQASAVDSGDYRAMMDPITTVRELGLQLIPQEGGAPIIPVMIQIRGDRASFRY